MKDTLVSIITPCMNSEKTIRKTIESVLNQTHKNIEYIIVDGLSTDGTINIVKEYIEVFGSRIKLISEHDDGIYDAMNKGIKACTGILIGIINSDDYYESNAVEIMLNAMTDVPHQVLYGIVRVLDKGKEYILYLYNHHYLNKLMIPHPTCFVTKKTYEDYGLFSTKYKLSSDYDFMIRNYLTNKITFIPVYRVIANFSLGGASSDVLASLEACKIRKEYGIYSKTTYIVNIILVRLINVVKIVLSKMSIN